jgi:zinc protease
MALLGEQALPGASARRLFYRIAFSEAHPSGRSQPTRKELDAVTPAALTDYLVRMLRPDNAVLLLAGNVDPATAYSLVAARFGAWAGHGEAPGRALPEPVSYPPGPLTIHLVDRPGSQQAELLVGLPSADRRDDDHARLTMLASLVGGGTGGRLFRDLRERRGLAYAIEAEQTDDGAFLVSTQARHEKLTALLSGVIDHLALLSGQAPAECETSMLRQRTLAEQTFTLATSRGRIEEMTRIARWDLPLDASARRREALASATRSQLADTSVRRLAGRPEVVVIGDGSWLATALQDGFPEARIVRHRADLAGER